MALHLTTIVWRSRRRIQLFFDQTLAAGAYATAPYEVTNVDSLGVDPGVNEAFLVPNSPHVVELALSEDLVDNGLYEVACMAVPDTEPATFTGTMQFRAPASPVAPSSSVAANDVQAELYGIDLVWDGRHFVEDARGDLATVAGLDNVQPALNRAVESDGLPWDEAYGGKPRRFVDAPSVTLPSLRGNIQRTLLADDRVRSVTSTILTDDNSGTPSLDVSIELIGNKQVSLTKDAKSPR